MSKYAAIGVGGVIGGLLRYALSLLPNITSASLETLAINLIGSLVLGLFYGIAQMIPIRPWLRFGFGSGVIGAFTTFSTWCWDTNAVMSSSLDMGILYLVITLLGGPMLAYAGNLIVQRHAQRVGKTLEELSL